MADDSILESFEKRTQERFQQSSFGKKASGDIFFDLDWGTAGMSGKLTVGTFRKTDMWVHDFAKSIKWEAAQDLMDLYEASKALPNGPIYKCAISIKNGRASFRYYFEKEPIRSLSDIAKNDYGTYPLFAYRTYFTEELIEASGKGELRIGHQALVEVLLPSGAELPEHHMEFYALNDFIGDFYNGGLNQYFGRTITWDEARYERAKLFPRLKQALIKLGREQAAAMIDEAVAIFAHYNEHVEEARKNMKIPSVPKQEESDIGPRFWDIIDEIETEAEAYMKAHKSEFAYH